MQLQEIDQSHLNMFLKVSFAQSVLNMFLKRVTFAQSVLNMFLKWVTFAQSVLNMFLKGILCSISLEYVLKRVGETGASSALGHVQHVAIFGM